ncbi:phosphotransferase family protein [Flindersiella endophytica]
MTTPAIRIVAERFGLGEVLDAHPVQEAWSNEVVRVRTAERTYALKLFPSGFTADRLTTLREAMAFEAAVLESGLVPMPQPVAADGGWLAEIPTEAEIRLARCHEWVTGTPASAAQRGAEWIRQAGRILGVLHAMHVPGGDSSQLRGPDRERWNRAVSDAARAGFAWAGRLAALTPVVDDLASQVEQVRAERRPMRFSHRDFDPKNAVVLSGDRIAVTDWDYAGPVLPDVELVVAAMSFANPDDPDGSARAFVSAYRAAGGDAEPSDPLGLAVETADIDWLLRNVEACVRADANADDLPARHETVDHLIDDYRAAPADLRAWADRISHVCG